MLGDHISALPFDLIGTESAAGLALTQAAGDLAVFPIPFKCILLYSALAITTTCGGDTTKPQVKMDIRPTAGSDTGRGDGDAGSFDLGTMAGGKFVYWMPGTRVELEPGQEVVMQLSQIAAGTGAAGAARPVLVVEHAAEAWANLDSAVAATEV
ncbi:MAG: hypothetical protein ACOY4W_16760 [Thermodesulfobacteriota bacterium]